MWGFKSAAKFSPKNLEDLFREKFADIKISELMKPCIILTYDMIQKSLFLFKSTDDTNRRDFLVRDTLRSTTAGPTYFPPAKIKNLASDSFRDPECGEMINIDGGLVAINPSVFAFTEAGKINFETRNNNRPTIFDLQILSIGSGSRNFKIEDFERSNQWGVMKWIQLMPKIIFEGGIDMVEFQMQGIFQNSNLAHEQAYLRINAPKEIRGNSSDITNASPRNVLNLVKAGEKTVEYAKSQGLERFLDTLLD